LKEKQVLSPSHFHRVFDQAKTPFDRLKEKNSLNDKKLLELETLRTQTNPMTLRSEINSLIDDLLALPCLDKSDTVNILLLL
jgi:hypothetical protein